MPLYEYNSEGKSCLARGFGILGLYKTRLLTYAPKKGKKATRFCKLILIYPIIKGVKQRQSFFQLFGFPAN